MTRKNVIYLLKRALIERNLFSKMYARVNVFFNLHESIFIKTQIGEIDKKVGKLAYIIFSKCIPVVENKVLLMTFKGGFDCNPKAIAKGIINQDKTIEVVWVIKSEYYKNLDLFPSDLKIVRWGSLEFYNEAASSKIWVDNSIVSGTLGLEKKKQQILIETWHGSIGLKRFDSNNNKKWIKLAKHCASMTDYLISNSSFETQLYRSTFWQKSVILEYGHPRNDILFLSGSEKDYLKKKVFKQLNIPTDYKLILYGPTFRDNYSNFDVYKLDYQLVVNSFKQKFGGNWAIAIRFHPRIRNFLKREGLTGLIPSDVYDATDYSDISELLAVCDAGISDYSSWICDFAESFKPSFLFILDLKDYYSERGFTIPLNETPFSVSESNEALAENIITFDEKQFIERCKTFYRNHGCIDDGSATTRVVKTIVDRLQYTNNDAQFEKEIILNVQKCLKGKKQNEKQLRKELEKGHDWARIELFDRLWDKNTPSTDREMMFLIKPLVDKNNLEAKLRLAKSLLYGRGIDKDVKEALSLLVNLEKEKSKDAIFLLFDIFYNNYYVKEKYTDISYLLELANEGNTKAFIRIGRAYWKGIGVKIDLKEAVEWMQRARTAGNIDATIDLFNILWKINTKESRKEMIELIRPLAENKNVDAMYCLACAYWKGKGVSKNLQEAELWMRNAYYAGHAKGHYALYDILYERNSTLSRIELLRCLFDPSNSSDGEILGRLGRVYRDGIVVQKDIDLSIRYYEKASSDNIQWATLELFDLLTKQKQYTGLLKIIQPLATDGNGEAMGRLAELYRYGRGVERNLDNAKYWMEKAVNENIGWCKNHLFDIMREMDDPNYYKEMYELIFPFAEYGNPSAMVRLAYLYAEGKGTEINQEAAIDLLKKARQKGVKTGDLTLLTLLLHKKDVNNISLMKEIVNSKLFNKEEKIAYITIINNLEVDNNE